MASSPITSWQTEREKVEAVTDFIFLSSNKITVDGDCSHEIKRCLLFGQKAMTNLDSVLKSKDITLLTKVCIVKVMVFPVVLYRRKCWTYVGRRSLVWYSPWDCQESDRTQQVDNNKHTVRSLNRNDNRQK